MMKLRMRVSMGMTSPKSQPIYLQELGISPRGLMRIQRNYMTMIMTMTMITTMMKLRMRVSMGMTSPRSQLIYLQELGISPRGLRFMLSMRINVA